MANRMDTLALMASLAGFAAMIGLGIMILSGVLQLTHFLAVAQLLFATGILGLFTVAVHNKRETGSFSPKDRA